MTKTVFAAALAIASGTASAQFFNSEAAFNAQLLSSFSEDFAGIQTGLVATPLSFSGNGFGFTAEAVDSPLDGDGFDDGLFNDPGILSTNSAGDGIQFSFSGPVTAFGGNFFASDINFLPQAFSITFAFADGSSTTVNTVSGNEFTGYINMAGITGVFVDAPDAGAPNWVAAGFVTVGSAVPAPASALALAGLAVARRRR